MNNYTHSHTPEETVQHKFDQLISSAEFPTPSSRYKIIADSLQHDINHNQRARDPHVDDFVLETTTALLKFYLSSSKRHKQIRDRILGRLREVVLAIKADDEALLALIDEALDPATFLERFGEQMMRTQSLLAEIATIDRCDTEAVDKLARMLMAKRLCSVVSTDAQPDAEDYREAAIQLEASASKLDPSRVNLAAILADGIWVLIVRELSNSAPLKAIRDRIAEELSIRLELEIRRIHTAAGKPIPAEFLPSLVSAKD